MTRFIGRTEELEGLIGLVKKSSASLVVIRGRRRIGKSRLAEEFSKSFKKSFSLTGIPPEKGVTAKMQREEFARQMKRLKIPITNSDDWGDLFQDLALHTAKGSVVIILDEITWMGSLDPSFLPKLKTIWDTLFKKNPKLVLILSGSNSAWIEKNILSSTGFMGRVSFQLQLKELPLPLCSKFWGAQNPSIDAYEKFKVLSVTGGIPRYLEEVRKDLSAEQNILNLCYKSTGILFNEFDQIFSDLFTTRNQIYKELVRQAAGKETTRSEIIKGLNCSNGGDLSDYIQDLVEAGFLTKDVSWNIQEIREERLSHYRVCDNYIRFYLKYIEPFKSRILAGRVTTLPRGWKSIMGLQFENLVCNNADALFKVLSICPDEVLFAGPFIQIAGERKLGCQIDYLIQTKQSTLYLCEVKFSEKEVPYSVVKEMMEKSSRLKTPKGFSKRHVLIHVNGVSEKIEECELISNIVNFGELLK